jgi:hypothetical protein
VPLFSFADQIITPPAVTQSSIFGIGFNEIPAS